MAIFAQACRQKDSRFSDTLSSARCAVAQGNLLYMFALANTQSARGAVARGNLFYLFALANTQSVTAPTGTHTVTATRSTTWMRKDWL